MNRKYIFMLPLLGLLAGCFASSQKFEVNSTGWTLMNPPLAGYEEIAANQINHKVLVGILDSGTDYNSKWLRKSIHLFPAPEKMGRTYGVGLDLLGQDYFPGPRIFNRLTGLNGEDVTEKYEHQLDHGTHVAGLVSLGNPEIGIIPVRVLPLLETPATQLQCKKGKDECAIAAISAEIEWILKGLAFCVAKDARIVNMSLGMPVDGFPAEISKKLLDKANAMLSRKMNGLWKKVLMVVAAGNEGRILTQVTESIPATLDVEQMLVVGALKDKHTIAEYSNYGRMVDVYVRGSDIMSTVPDNLRDTMSGTSMAAPLAAHLAAELVAIDSTLYARELRGIILNTADRMELEVETDEPGATPDKRSVLVINFLNAKKKARWLLSHPEEREKWTTPPFSHGKAPI